MSDLRKASWLLIWLATAYGLESSWSLILFPLVLSDTLGIFLDGTFLTLLSMASFSSIYESLLADPNFSVWLKFLLPRLELVFSLLPPWLFITVFSDTCRRIVGAYYNFSLGPSKVFSDISYSRSLNLRALGDYSLSVSPNCKSCIFSIDLFRS